MLLATALAVFTLTYKVEVYYFSNTTVTVIYWFLFIFYSFAALDELIEVYSVFAKREKGALGLLFEMNYFLGLFTLGCVMWAAKHFEESDF